MHTCNNCREWRELKKMTDYSKITKNNLKFKDVILPSEYTENDETFNLTAEKQHEKTK